MAKTGGAGAVVAFDGFPEASFAFLAGIAAHNEKSWFDANRDLYERGYVAPGLAFVSALGPLLKAISPSVRVEPRINGSLQRVNRDIRFSKDKRPYKSHLNVWFWHGDRKGWEGPGFWFQLSVDRVSLGVGLHGMRGEVLDSFRQSVIHPRSARALLAAVEAVKAAGPYSVGEPTRKLMPRGFAADGAAAEYLLYESLHAFAELPAEAARSADFAEVCARHYAAMWPIGQWLLDEVSSGA